MQVEKIAREFFCRTKDANFRVFFSILYRYPQTAKPILERTSA
jgi:hypothetical protein